MIKILPSLILLFAVNFIFAQDCGKSELSIAINQKKDLDSIYKKDIEKRIEYFAILNKEILPKYSSLKNQILNSIENSDLKEILEIKNVYDQNRLAYLTEMKETQNRVYDNVTAYSRLNTIILFETLDTFPDSYAIIFNSSLINTKVRERDLVNMNRINVKYSKKLFEFSKCFQLMKSEINSAKYELGIKDIFQNAGNKTVEDTVKTDVINLLIWSLK